MNGEPPVHFLVTAGINFAGEGGLYAEMIRNRSFYSATSPLYWTLVTQGTAAGVISVDTAKPLNANNPNSLKLTMHSGTGSVGAGNAGFWGMSLQSGATYDLNFYVAGSSGFSGPVIAQLQNASGSTVYAQTRNRIRVVEEFREHLKPRCLRIQVISFWWRRHLAQQDVLLEYLKMVVALCGIPQNAARVRIKQFMLEQR